MMKSQKHEHQFKKINKFGLERNRKWIFKTGKMRLEFSIQSFITCIINKQASTRVEEYIFEMKKIQKYFQMLKNLRVCSIRFITNQSKMLTKIDQRGNFLLKY